MVTIANKVVKAIFRPEIRLPNTFPMSGKQFGKAYVMTTVWFVIGTFAPIALFLGTGLALAAIGWLMLNFLPLSITTPLFALTNPIAQAFGALAADKTRFMVLISLASFVSGFGAKIWYLQRYMKSKGDSLWPYLRLNLDSLRGDSRLATSWSFIWRVAFSIVLWYGFTQLLGLVMPEPQQPTMDLTRNLSGGNLFVWFGLVALLAPLAEEVFFRGFQFQALRSSIKGSWIGRLLGGSDRAVDLLATVIGASFFAVGHLQFFWPTLVMLFLMGCYMSELYRRTGTLWTGIAFHAVNNGFVVIYLAVLT